MDRPSPKVLLADDHRLVAQGIAGLLSSRFEVVGIVDNGQDLCREASVKSPDVVVTDISMPDLDGLQVTRELRRAQPTVPVVVLTMHDDPGHAKDAFQSGASAYVVKSCAPFELFDAIDKVLAGERYVSPVVAGKMLDLWIDSPSETKPEPLSRREWQVARLVADGLENAEIAERLCIAQVTVRTHLLHIQRKLGLKNRVAIARFALERG